MKRLVFFVIVLSVCLTSCAKKPSIAEDFALPLTITVSTNGKSEFTAFIFEDHSEIRFESEHIFEGTVLRFSDEGNTARVGNNFSRSIKNGCFPAQEALCKAVRGLTQSKDMQISQNQIKYTIDEMTVIVYYDKNTEAVIGIETEEGGRRFVFDVISLEPYEAQSKSVG